MKIILNDFVSTLGAPGDEITVADGYARNYLIPKKFAIEATEANRTTFANNLKHRARKLVKIKSEAQAKQKQIEALDTLVFSRKAAEEGRLFGSVTSGDIEEALASHGFTIDKKQIELKQPIKSVCEMSVFIKVFSGVKAAISVRVEAEFIESTPDDDTLYGETALVEATPAYPEAEEPDSAEAEADADADADADNVSDVSEVDETTAGAETSE